MNCPTCTCTLYMYIHTCTCISSSANLLGSGGYGAVYKAMYRDKPVAVKIFSEKAAKINNTTPNYLLRLEVHVHVRILCLRIRMYMYM